MNPSAGNFMTLDTYAGTLDDPASLHKYLYVHANPVAYSDPTGHMISVIGQTTALGYSIELRSSQAAYNAMIISTGMKVLKSLLWTMAYVAAVSNVSYEISILVDEVDWLTVVATESIEQVKARVEAKLEAGTLSKRGDGESYTVYTLKDASGIVRYVGRTIDYDERMKQHERLPNGVIAKYGLEPEARYDNLTYEVCRGLEQTLMVYYHTRSWLKEDGYNKINGIGNTNPKGEMYYTETITYLENQIDNERLN